MLILLKMPIFYITRDIERALGTNLNIPNYYIISNYSQYGKSLAKKYKNIVLIKEKRILDTWELMNSLKVKQYIKNTTQKPNILVFKNTSQIEKICQKNNWNLLNPPSKLTNEIEQKISQVKWAGSLKKYFPNYEIKKCKDTKWNGEKIIIQFNQSHTGSGTILIKNKKQLDEIKQKFPERLIRTAKYIKGPLFTNNNIIWNKKIIIGNISYQITGLKPFTDVKFATIGNDWALPHKILSKKQLNQFYKIAQDVGEKMKKSAWQGAFGIDVVMDEKTKKMYLVEINARQSASVSFESELQNNIIKLQKIQNYEMTIFQAHLASLLGIKYNKEKLIKITNGAQIIYRVNNNKPNNKLIRNSKQQLINNKKILEKNELKIILYNNTKPNSDLLRIQSKIGIMNQHNKFNKIGLKIKTILKIKIL